MRIFFKFRTGRDDQGTAAIEFAFIAPVMIVMFVGMYDVSNFIFCNNKMYATAQQISNIVTRGDVTKPQLDAMLQAAHNISQPFAFEGNGTVIVTSVSQTNPDLTKGPSKMWQDSYGAGHGSNINLSKLPGNLNLTLNETVICTEVFYTYKPLFPTFNLLPASSTQIYFVVAALPRQGTMTALPSS